MTTPVGSISLNLSIDGSDLDSEITEAVRRHMEPAMARLQQQLERIERQQAAVARAAEKSSAKQTAAAKTVAGAVRDVGDEHVKAGAKTRAAEGVSTRSINAATRAIERQTAAWTANAAARATAAAAPTPQGPPTGGGGGGRGGGGGGGVKWHGGRGGFLGSPVGLNAAALGLGALPAAATAVVNLTGALQQLVQTGGLLPGVIGGIVSSVGTAKLGFMGLKDAASAAWEAAKSGDPKDIKKAAEAMEDLAPAAKSVVTAIAAARPHFEKLQRDIVQQNMFEGVDQTVTDFLDKSMPTFEKGLGGISKAWNATFKELGRVGGLDSSQSIMDKVFGNTADAQKRANAAIGPLVHGMGTLTAESSDFLSRLADGLTSVTTRFDNWITRSAGNGNLDTWINEGIEAAKHFGETLLNIGKIVASITKAAGGDGGLLGALDRGSSALSKFLASDQGQEKLTRFFDEGRDQLRQWAPILGNLASIMGDVFEAAKQWSGVLLPVLKAVTDVLSDMPGGISAVVVAFLAWRTISGVSALTASIAGLGSSLDTLPGRAGKAATGIRGAFAKLTGTRGTAGGALLAGGALTSTSAESGWGQLLGAAEMIGGGALAGSAFGPAGTVVGAGIGVAAAGVAWAVRDVAQANREAAASWDEYNARIQRATDASIAMQDAQKTLSDSLLGSQGKIDSSSIGAVQAKIDAIPDSLAGRYSPEAVEQVVASLKELNLTQEQLATIVSGGQPVFDALLTNLRNMSPGGNMAADALTRVRDSVLAAQQAGTTAGPSLQALASTLGVDIPQAAANLRTVFAALPTEVPINITSTEGGQAVLDMLQKMNLAVQTDNEKNITVTAPDAPRVLETLRSIGVEAKIQDNKLVVVNVDDTQAKQAMNNFFDRYAQLSVNVAVGGPNTNTNMNAPRVPGTLWPGTILPPGRADGGVLPGWSPGRDNMLVPMSGGEGVLIPEAVRALGGAAGIYAINSRYRSGLSRQGYADGGVVGGVPGMDDNTELGVLRQIRDLLAGKGGGPLPATSDAISSIASDATKAGAGNTPGRVGPFGTPIKARNPAYEAAAAAIQALGGDPEKWIGADPTRYAPSGIGMGGAAGGGVGGFSRYAALLSAFARSGNLGADLVGAGLDANDPVIKAITAARNKKRGALGDDAIAGLVEQIVGGGGYTGTLDSSNSALIGALQTFREKLGRGSGFGAARSGGGPRGSKTGLQPNASQLFDVIAAQFPEVREIGGVRADRIPDHPSGRALDIMVGKDQALGDRINAYLRANAATLGLDSTIWRDQWEDLNGNSSMVPGHQDHIHAKVAEGAATGLGPLVPPGAAALGGGGGVVPVFVTNFDGQMRGGLGGPMLDALGQSGGQVASGVAGDIMGAVAGLGQEPWNTKNATSAELNRLVQERNPLALAKALGLNVQDFTRQGGDGGELTTNDGAAFDASGRMFSDTGALLDRTFTSVNAQLNAMREQLVDVIEQVSAKLNDEALEPVVKAGVQSALESLKDSVSAQIGTAMGQAAAPPIADAVRSAIPADGGGGAAGIGGNIAGALFATGGPVYGGVPGRDSVPALLTPDEHVLTTDDVARMGGHAGVYAFRAALARHGGVRGFATGGGVNVNDTVGAEFFGVSQIPILGAIVNLLVRVLLRVLEVEIEARDTLSEMTDEFRQFRGEFQAFDASGRLMNDTSALLDRSSTSEQEAAQERIRILKIVIQALIKFIIEKVIVPIAKAVANAAIQAGASAAGAAVNTQAPGAGGIVSALISSGGQAGVEIAAEIGSQFAVALSEVIIDVLADGLQSYFPDAVGAIFGGGLMENLIAAPISGALEMPLAMIGTLTGGLAGLFAPLLAILGGGTFDNGGMAHGVGLMPKATIQPERVLSPQQTILFERMITALERNPRSTASSPTYVTAQINVDGGPEAGRRVRDGLLELMS